MYYIRSIRLVSDTSKHALGDISMTNLMIVSTQQLTAQSPRYASVGIPSYQLGGGMRRVLIRTCTVAAGGRAAAGGARAGRPRRDGPQVRKTPSWPRTWANFSLL